MAKELIPVVPDYAKFNSEAVDLFSACASGGVLDVSFGAVFGLAVAGARFSVEELVNRAEESFAARASTAGIICPLLELI